MRGMKQILDTPAAELPWLWAFENDYMRLAAVAIVALSVIIVLCAGHVVTAWRMDRDSKRTFELENKRLQDKLSARRKRIKS